jgi:hypothetical protein
VDRVRRERFLPSAGLIDKHRAIGSGPERLQGNFLAFYVQSNDLRQLPRSIALNVVICGWHDQWRFRPGFPLRNDSQTKLAIRTGETLSCKPHTTVVFISCSESARSHLDSPAAIAKSNQPLTAVLSNPPATY